MPDYQREHTLASDNQPAGLPEGTRRKQQAQQPRQLLSCTKCRERKVKCDRTKPCSACCARGQPKDCHFIAEGGDYAPIQQSYELRKLRAENIRLKERLRASRISIEEEDSDAAQSPESQLSERPGSSQRRRTAKQKRFQGSEWQDSIYFGSPGLASLVADFAAINIRPGSASLAHLMPRGPDMYTPKNPPPHPFPTFFPATPEECIPQLLECLPQKEELLKCLSAFEERVNICSFPHVPFEITRSEVERFLNDARRNAQMCPDMLALLFAAIALGGQHSVWDRSGGQWEADAMHFEVAKGDVYIAAAMQALRLASFMHKPSLLGIQALIMIGPYLTNSGRFLDAWTLFGTTIRLAHSIGLHRHPKYLDPAPPSQRECSIRQTLWWWMLHMDEQYSMTLGRPLGISGIGDCPSPLELTTDRHMLRFGDFVVHFTILARRVLSSDRLNNTKIDEFTDEFKALLDTMPEMLQFDKSWGSENKEIPEWPLSAMAAVYHCKAHTYLILLNRQRLDKYTTQPQMPDTGTPASNFRPVNRSTPSSHASPTTTITLLRGRALVLASSEDILAAFIFFYNRVPAALISWTMGQQAFNACMILLLDALERRDFTPGVRNIERAFVIFSELQAVHKLASLAVERISRGLKELHDILESHTGTPSPTQNSGAGTQGTWSEAMRAPHDMCGDTVMNATGMLLLEDPGLQGFVPEAFAPIAWRMGEHELPMQFQVKREGDILHGRTRAATGHFDSTGSDEEDHRSAGVMQGIRRSTTIRSAPTRYATPTMDDSQPPGVTAPTSRTSLARPMQRQHQYRIASTEVPYPGSRTPHLRHAQLREMSNVGWGHKSVANAPATAPLHHTGRFPGLSHDSVTQMRHNSCPSIPQPASAPPVSQSAQSSFNTPSGQAPAASSQPLRKLSVISDQASFQDFLETIPSSRNPAASSGVHSGWAASPADRAESFQMTDATLDFSQPSHIDRVDPHFSPSISQGHEIASSYPMHFSQATSMATPSSTEQLAADEWKLWMTCSSGAA